VSLSWRWRRSWKQAWPGPEALLSSGFKLAVAGVFALLFAIYIGLLGWGRRAKPANP
jgi:hypothetical protein